MGTGKSLRAHVIQSMLYSQQARQACYGTYLTDLAQICQQVGLYSLVKERTRWDCFILVTSPSALLSVAKQVHPTLWESTSEIIITKNALALLLTVLVGNL
jgi:hypothetical protein